MPRIILEFSTPEEEEEAALALDGRKYAAVVWNLDRWLRSEIKYTERAELVKTVLQEVRDQLRGHLEEEGLEI